MSILDRMHHMNQDKRNMNNDSTIITEEEYESFKDEVRNYEEDNIDSPCDFSSGGSVSDDEGYSVSQTDRDIIGEENLHKIDLNSINSFHMEHFFPQNASTCDSVTNINFGEPLCNNNDDYSFKMYEYWQKWQEIILQESNPFGSQSEDLGSRSNRGQLSMLGNEIKELENSNEKSTGTEILPISNQSDRFTLRIDNLKSTDADKIEKLVLENEMLQENYIKEKDEKVFIVESLQKALKEVEECNQVISDLKRKNEKLCKDNKILDKNLGMRRKNLAIHDLNKYQLFNENSMCFVKTFEETTLLQNPKDSKSVEKEAMSPAVVTELRKVAFLNKKYRNEIDSFKKRSDESKMLINDLKSKISKYESDIVRKTDEIIYLSEQIKVTNEKNDRLSDVQKLNKLTRNCDDSNYLSYHNKVVLYEKKIAVLDAENLDLVKGYEVEIMNIGKITGKLELKVNHMKIENDKLNSNIVELKLNLDKHISECDKLNKDLATAKEAFKSEVLDLRYKNKILYKDAIQKIYHYINEGEKLNDKNKDKDRQVNSWLCRSKERIVGTLDKICHKLKELIGYHPDIIPIFQALKILRRRVDNKLKLDG